MPNSHMELIESLLCFDAQEALLIALDIVFGQIDIDPPD